jgi:transcriptional regulator with XRE-family HTH domain
VTGSRPCEQLLAVGARGKARRRELGLDVAIVAERMNITAQRLYQLECYGAGTLATVERWAAALEMDPRDLAFGRGELGDHLVDLLRAVQLEHSRALIELSPRLEAGIILAIGLHPRDGGE